MVTYTQSSQVLALGKKLVEELGLDPSVDTLGRWMAHYIAQLIDESESATAEDKQKKLEKCAAAIANLWEHRSVMPSGKRPFEDIEPILRALESLDPSNDAPRYFRDARESANGTEQPEEVINWLKIAKGLDDSARILIMYCITLAAQNAINTSEEWVSLARSSGMTEGVDISTFLVLDKERSLYSESDLSDKQRETIESRIEKLETFVEISRRLVAQLHQQLDNLPKVSDDD